MAKKAKTAARKTINERLIEAREDAYQHGRIQGQADVEFRMGPNVYHKEHLIDFVRLIESWGALSEDSVVMFAGTDLKHHAHAAIPLRLLRVVGKELKRLGYAPEVH